MANYALLVDKYFPFPSSNGVVASNVIDCLKKRGHSIVVFSVYRSYGENVFSLDKKNVSTNMINKLCGFFQDDKTVNDLTNLVLSRNKIKPFDYVITFYRSIETVLAAIKIGNLLGIKRFVVFLDIPGLDLKQKWKRFVQKKNYMRLFKKLLYQCTVISLKYYYNYFGVVDKKNKIRYIGIPNLVEKKGLCCRHEDIHIVYSGSFYKDIRNPEKMLNYLKFIIGTNIVLHLYSWSCDDVLEDYKAIYGRNLILHGRVDLEQIDFALKNANIFINLSNDCDFQVPGKIMEYFSYGKPVISFVFNAKDPGIADYKKYPLSLIVDLSKPYDQQKTFDFICKNANISLPFENIRQLFIDSTPDYLVNLLMQAK